MLRWVVHLKGRPKREHHAAVAVGHKVYSFGGFHYGETYRQDGQIEMHIFNTVSLRWVKLPPVTNGRGEHPLDVPSMRYGHTAVLIEDIIYIWGGFTYMGEYCNMLYAIDVHTHGWFKLRISGSVPEARRGHSACVLGKVMYIFGGFNMLTRYTNDIHTLDTATMAWTLINARGTPAPASTCHSATIVGTKMFVFGGRGDQFNYNKNARVFDTETGCWLSTPPVQLLPKGRGAHSAFAYDTELYIFGGRNFLLDQSFNDLWKFNTETFSWMKVEPKGKGPCWMSRMCCCMVGDRIILFGGYRYRYTPIQVEDLEDEDDVSDMYILDLSPSLKTLCKLAIIHYGLEQSGLPHDIRWELAAMSTNTNRKERWL